MTFSASQYQRPAEAIRRDIEMTLFGLGILCRVFSRGKTEQSLRNKMAAVVGKYSFGGKLIQDAVGIRIVLYFPEDIEIVRSVLSKKYLCDERASSIDLPGEDTFSVTRYNLIYKLPDPHGREVERLRASMPIDTTFEVQLRTVLSEGWHEVEHDLRYKCPTHWEAQPDLNRTLNGVMATLETAEWTMSTVFDELSYRHYKSKKWVPMLHTRLRMRVEARLDPNIENVLDADAGCAKGYLRIDRRLIIARLSEMSTKIPVNLDNVSFLWNFLEVKNAEIQSLVPAFLDECFRELTVN